ncbi:VWA domain-containing protein [Spongiibacter sp.]|uniref:VWA domain-containing protein n=1 Tax=Spongiibacter sp. TaxID=2024860 RepID=UPI003563670F
MIELHWLRLDWAWTALPLLAALLLSLRQSRGDRRWQHYIDAELLPHLLDTPAAGKRRRWPLALAALLCWLAILGPSWQRLPSPVLEDRAGLVIVLDLSPSMLAEDLQPSRLQRAKYAIRDLLKLRADGQTGLVASAGDAFVVAPLTDDGNTLNTLLPALHPAMMPIQGSNPLAGLQRAAELLQRAASPNGHILLISDGFSATQLKGLEQFVSNTDIPVSILGVGSEQGAPIPLPEGGFVKDEQGQMVLARMPEALMQSLARRSGGNYLSLQNSLSEAQLTALAKGSQSLAESERHQQFEQWRDGGVWLCLLLLPIALLGFRRSVLPVALLAAITLPEQGYALDWQHPWQTADQRGAELFERDPAAAAQHFRDPLWRGSAHYRAGDYQAAAQAFAQADTADAHYNRGNALARSGDLDAAIAAYEQALKSNPEMSDARANKALLESLKQQQQQSSESENNDGGEPQSSDSNSSPGARSQDGDSQSETAQPEQASDDQSAPDAEDRATNADDPAASPEQQEQAAQRQAAEQHATNQDSAQSQSPAQPSPESPQGDDAEQQLAVSEGTLSEEEQAQEQWLRNIPDSADQLLRNKFQYQFQQRRRRGELPEADHYAPY